MAVIKTLEYDPNFVTEIKKVSPKTLLIARMDLPQLDLGSLTDPVGAARAFVDKLLPIATEPRRKAAIDAWEAYNEPVAETPENMARLAQFEAERTRSLAEQGIRSVVGNFSTGTPPLELWPQFRPALEAAIKHRGYLGLHEYSAPTMQFGTPQDPLGWGTDPAQAGWLTLRYRKVYRDYLAPNKLTLPLVITETGIDGAVANGPAPRRKGGRTSASIGRRSAWGTMRPATTWSNWPGTTPACARTTTCKARPSSPGRRRRGSTPMRCWTRCSRS